MIWPPSWFSEGLNTFDCLEFFFVTGRDHIAVILVLYPFFLFPLFVSMIETGAREQTEGKKAERMGKHQQQSRSKNESEINERGRRTHE